MKNRFHKQVIETVKKVIKKYGRAKPYQLAGKLIVFACPMQSGKTELIEHTFLELKKLYPDACGFYICGYNHTDFNSQNSQRLEHLEANDFQYLRFKDRNSIIKDKRILKATGRPMILFFDENHFADGVDQSIDAFLLKHEAFKKALLIGVSATPFSSISRADSIFKFDKTHMPSYKGITDMYDEGDIVEAEPIMDRSGSVLRDSNAYKYLSGLINSGVTGYALIRCNPFKNANELKRVLKKEFKEKIHVRDWNQSNPLNPDYFLADRGVFTVVLVQQKARMGNTIPTENIKMVYEYSPNATVATIAQGLPGRCCGHGKMDHGVKVFTHVDQIRAYMLFERNPEKPSDFAKFCKKHGLIPSGRSEVKAERADIIGGFLKVGNTNLAHPELRRKFIPVVKKALAQHGFKDFAGNPHNHYLSTSKTYREHWIKGFKTLNNPLFTKGLKRDPGSLAILYADDPETGLHSQICWAYRLPTSSDHFLDGKDSSIYKRSY